MTVLARLMNHENADLIDEQVLLWIAPILSLKLNTSHSDLALSTSVAVAILQTVRLDVFLHPGWHFLMLRDNAIQDLGMDSLKEDIGLDTAQILVNSYLVCDFAHLDRLT